MKFEKRGEAYATVRDIRAYFPGAEFCEPAVTHGPVKTAGRCFAHADGTVFHPFGATVCALAHQSRELIERTMAALSDAPINKVRMCVFPKCCDFNRNEPDYFAFKKASDGMGMQAERILFHLYGHPLSCHNIFNERLP